MGGFGSGRYGHITTTKVDEGLKLDINKLKRDGLIGLNSSRSGTLTWTRVGTGEETGSIGYEVNTLDLNDMWMRVHYTHKSYWDDEPNIMDYKIKLETTQPNYGGKRLWFTCPLTHERVGVLYSPPGSKWFASRHAYNLKYQSQSRSAHDRAIDKMWKLKDRLGGHEYWRKPKGMHWSTYERQMKKVRQAEDVCNGHLIEVSEKSGGMGVSLL